MLLNCPKKRCQINKFSENSKSKLSSILKFYQISGLVLRAETKLPKCKIETAGLVIYVTDGMFYMNRTTGVPKSVLHYTVDKVRQVFETEVCYFNVSFVQN